MAPIQARSTAEALEYMMLAVPECGDELAIEFVESYRDGGEWVDAYVAGCAARGVRREFTFTLDPRPSGTDARLFGSGPEPSRLIDAGEWYLIFGRYMEAGLAEE